MNIKHRLAAIFIPGLLSAMAAQAAAGPRCEVASGARTAALVELYSSEGCSSCPPADQRLNALSKDASAAGLVVPLALHVTYWDRIGWTDTLAQLRFDARQAELLRGQPHHVAYTPQFFVGGKEVRGWAAQLPASIAYINAMPAAVNLRLSAMPVQDGKLQLEAHADAVDGHTGGKLYLAVSESGIVSQVLRGENRGATLRHDAAVRLWLGPVPLVQGRASLRREVSLPAGWRQDRLQAVAFVQQAEGSTILQAVAMAPCARGAL